MPPPGGTSATRFRGRWPERYIEKLNGGPVNNVRFFHMTEISIAGIRCRALRHGMAGAIGLRAVGAVGAPGPRPRGHCRGRPGVRPAAGGRHELPHRCSQVRGWYQMLVPAIYTSPSMAEYRKWLPADRLEGVLRLAGSLQRNHARTTTGPHTTSATGGSWARIRDYVGKGARSPRSGSQAGPR